jgi:uracil-DNA glycosylase family 4
MPSKDPFGLADCDNCPWKEHPYAGQKGPSDASILVVGEAPGAQEVEEGIPFTGPSGKLLGKVLAHHRLDSSQIRFTNVVACHPPFVRGQAPEVPPKSVLSACRPRLRQELLERETILILGNTAKEAIMGTREPITKVRQGPPKRHQRYGDTRLVPSIHPAACLRHSDSFPSLVKDVGKVKGGKLYVTWEAPKYAAFDEPESAAAALRALDNKRGPIAVDIEVGVDKDSDFTHPQDLLCVGIAYEPNKAFVLGQTALQSKEVQAALAAVLRDKDTTYHNGKYDEQVLMRLGVLEEPYMNFDTMLASYVLDERPGQHGLEGRAGETLGAPSWKHMLDRYKGKKDSYAVIPRPVLYRYNAYDVSQTYLLRGHDEKHLGQLRRVHDFLVEVAKELVYVELDGVGVDQARNEELWIELSDELYELETQLQELIKWPTFNPRSPQQIMVVLNGFKFDADNTNVETLQRLFAQSPAGSKRRLWLELLMQHRKLAKSFGTYVKGIRKRELNWRVYPTYLQHGTVSGRLSCRNPNLQNVTRGDTLRSQFIPEEGNVFVQGDYKQAELRVIATEGKDEYLREAFNDPTRDPLGEITTQFYGPNYTKEQRVRGKAVVYGVNYGREAASIASEYSMSVQEAADFIRSYFHMVPGVAAWRGRVKDQIFGGSNDSQALQTHFGRKRRFWLITRQNRVDVEKEGLSFIPQSTANDICLSALVRLRRLFGDSANSPRIRIPVHDSLLVECGVRDQASVSQTMKEVMEQTARDVYTDFVPFPVDIVTGSNWGEISG